MNEQLKEKVILRFVELSKKGHFITDDEVEELDKLAVQVELLSGPQVLSAIISPSTRNRLMHLL